MWERERLTSVLPVCLYRVVLAEWIAGAKKWKPFWSIIE